MRACWTSPGGCSPSGCEQVKPGTEVVAVEQPFAVPLIDQETREVLDLDLVGTLDLLERAAEGLGVVDLKTSARKYTEDQASYCSSVRAGGAHSG